MSITLSGSTYWLRSGGLHRASESKTGTMLAWVTAGDNDDALMFLFSASGYSLCLNRSEENRIAVTGKNSGGTTILRLVSESTTYTNSSTWLGILASWDLSAGEGYLYINREADLFAERTILTDDNVYLAAPPVAFGARSTGASGWVGNVGEFHLWDPYIDISDEDEIIKLISSDGVTDYANPGPTSGTPKPVGLGAGASGPFYKPPLVSFYGAFTGNKGYAGSFDQNGTFTWVDNDDDIKTYRQSGSPNALPGQRSFDSERTGWTYARHDTFIERRSGLSDYGKRLGIPEMADTSRNERPGHDQNFIRFIRGDEDDTEDRR